MQTKCIANKALGDKLKIKTFDLTYNMTKTTTEIVTLNGIGLTFFIGVLNLFITF